MIRRPPRSTRTDTLFPYTTLFRSSSREIKFAAIVSPDRGGITHLRAAPFQHLEHIRCPVQARLPLDDVFIALKDVIPHLTRSSLHRCLRSEEHTSELQSLMRISYAVFCLKKKKNLLYGDNLDIK